jgi:hypothetical protein
MRVLRLVQCVSSGSQPQSVVTAVSEQIVDNRLPRLVSVGFRGDGLFDIPQEAVQPPLELLELPRAGAREAVELRLQARELTAQLAPLAPSARFRPER